MTPKDPIRTKTPHPCRTRGAEKPQEGAAKAVWEAARAMLSGLPGGAGVNIAHEAVDRHAAGPLQHRTAFRWIGESGDVQELTYGRLAALTSRFANGLAALGIERGDRVFACADRIPELYIAAIGALKHGAVFCPLFSAFGPEPLYQRLERGDARALLTTGRIYRRKIAPLLPRLPRLQHVILADAAAEGTIAYPRFLDAAPDVYTIAPTDPEDPALLHFTSGTSGMPKGALHVHGAVVAHYATGAHVLDLRDGDLFWCTADPGWVTGTIYGLITPLVMGVTSIIDAGPFDAVRWMRLLSEQGVTVWYTSPSAIRRLMRLPPGAVRKEDFRRLRHILSVGEPLPPDAVAWGREVLDRTIHDTWWQTETGAIMVANVPGRPVRPGSMGMPIPGVTATVLQEGEAGAVGVVQDPETAGELGLAVGWPSMFRAYLGEPERYERCFSGGWYRSGDLVRRDADGYFWFVGRKDDIIKTSGQMVGPFEVERLLLSHPSVADAGVIGKPDAMLGESVKAFVVLKSGIRPDDESRRELIAFSRKNLGAAIAPREIEFISSIPRNRAGKVMRRLLKARETGGAAGDTSTLAE